MKKLFIVTLAALGMLACTENGPSSTTGALSGKFSVSASKQVQFSPGNLQYNAGAKTWRFAIHQYDTVGLQSINIYDGWIDLYGWGTGNNPTDANVSAQDYTFVDWGTNTIPYYGIQTGSWRTLSKDEWIFLFCNRANADSLFAMGNVNGVNGVILLPDNYWKNPAGVTLVVSSSCGLTMNGDNYDDKTNDHFIDNILSINQWYLLENNGAVFLPAVGIRSSIQDISSTNSGGYYWSSTPKDDFSAYALIFTSESLAPQSKASRNLGLSVRLVR